MPIMRRRRNHPYGVSANFNDAANYYNDDAETFSYYFDDAITLKYVTADA